MLTSEPGKRPTYGSLFSGVGGMDLGFDDHFDCVFQVEWDKNCQTILRRHWPQVPKWADVCDVNGAEIPPCDVLTFGSPCQDLSVAGKRAGLDGDRSSMFFEAIRIIKEMRHATRSEPTGPFPRVAVWENVPGALSSNGGADFRAVLDSMVDCGAVECEWAVLDAQHFGVPQRRRRVFLVAIFDPAIAANCPTTLLPVFKGGRRDYAKGRPARKSVAGSTPESVGETGECYRMLGFGDDTADDTASALKQRDHKSATDLAVVPVGSEGADPMLFTTNQRSEVRELGDLAVSLSASHGTNQTNYVAVAEAIPIQDGREMEKRQNGLGVGEEGEPSYTLDTTGGQAVGQPIIFENSFRDGARIGDDLCHTLPAKMGTGGNNQPHVAQPIVYDGYNQSADESGTHRTLRIGRDSSDFVAQPIEIEPVMLNFQGSKSNSLTTTDGTSFTLNSMHGHDVHVIGIPEVMAFDTQFGSNANVFTEMSPSLKSSQQSPSVAEPVLCFQPGMMVRQSGGVWEETAPTLRAEAKRGDNEPHIVQSHLAYEPETIGPLTAGGLHAPRGTETSDSNHVLAFIENSSEPVSAAETVMQPVYELAVRRLTPLECERLMGFGDNHTLIRDDGKEQADTHRYKQCGNGVATPVARWVAKQVVQLFGSPE